MIRFPFLKRLGDVVLSATALVLLVPVLAAVWVAVRMVMGRPVFFVDTRAGKDGRPISIRKFRSMRQAVDAGGVPLPDAERLGSFGRFLRRSSLDELPQLVSVLVGDMSVVGPRPLPLAYVPRYSQRQRQRLRVRPGLTGWAQIHGRNGVDWPVRLEYDAEYVDMLSRWYWPLVDLWIIGSTAVQVVWQAITGRSGHDAGVSSMSADSDAMRAETDPITSAVVVAIQQVLHDTGRAPAALDAGTLLSADVGLDSLDLAQTIVLLERSLGVDPFRAPAAAAVRPAIRTLADLAGIYRSCIPARMRAGQP
mgnify:CR=1 FL=1